MRTSSAGNRKLIDACALLLASASETDHGLFTVSAEHLKNLEALTVKAVLQAKKQPSKTDCVLCGDALGPDDCAPHHVRWTAKKLKAVKVHARCARDDRKAVRETWAFWDAFNAERTSAFDLETANTCQCGHKADSHAKDELENLLACKACDCDHFRMAIIEVNETADQWIAEHPEIAAANAASIKEYQAESWADAAAQADAEPKIGHNPRPIAA